MPFSKRKLKSHRLTLREKHHSLKKARERAGREAKRMKAMERKSRFRRDPGIPNLYPYKKQMLQAILKQDEMPSREAMAAQTAAKAVAQLQAMSDALTTSIPEDGTSCAPAGYSAAVDERYVDERSIRRGAFKQELRQVINQTDVLIEVIDARDPHSTRCPEIEELCYSQKKPFVLVLNKIDLIPPQVARAWLAFFQAHNLPCVIFKSSTKTEGIHFVDLAKFSAGQVGGIQAEERLTQAMHDPGAVIGATELKRVLHRLGSRSAPAESGPTKIIAGVVGIPNVGKSSIINSMAGRRAVGVSPVPGFTKKLSEIHVDLKLRILDSPGVVLNKAGNTVILREENLIDSVGECARMLSMTKDYAGVFKAFGVLDAVYEAAQTNESIATCLVKANGLLAESVAADSIYDDVAGTSARDLILAELTRTLLILIARQNGKLLRGGIPDIDWAAKHCVREWNRGTVPFYKPAPSPEEIVREAEVYKERLDHIQRMNNTELGDADRLVSELAPALDIEELYALSAGALGGTVDTAKYTALH
ncbi:Nucleolar GTPase [Giardia muris]|uniref:Nucleolar GTPase n=1 Tax=Giardia muris TaxID=5742 RepID=A0A4Z1SN29_GIAMU|nr:Nucleolar GTPase [Giardia muris]|eukprot:TNJ27142.1 Nucleolar GTPase [Giardia muris]